MMHVVLAFEALFQPELSWAVYLRVWGTHWVWLVSGDAFT